MVYYFTSSVVEPPGFIYVGKDKFENEDLIKFGWDEDVWVRSHGQLYGTGREG
ncbi:Coiled-coil domain-containing protein 25 [Fusarium falciforme]